MKRGWLGTCIVVMLASAGPSGLGSGAPSAALAAAAAPPAQQVLSVALREPLHLDPALVCCEPELWPVMALFDPLLAFDAAGQAVPVAAQSWSVSADGLTYTFRLRPGAVWSDGRAVTAGDYEYAWKRVANPATASPYAAATYPIRGALAYHQGVTRDPQNVAVRALNASTLQVTLAEPAVYFLHSLATWTFLPVPRRQVEARGPTWTQPGAFVGNGPFTLARWVPGQEMVLAANARYRGTRPTLRQVRFVFTSAAAPAGTEAFARGTVDVSFQLQPADAERIRSAAALAPQLHTYPGAGTAFVAFDTTNPASPFRNVKVRQALALAVDRARLTRASLRGLYSPAPTLAPPALVPGRAAALTGGAEEARKALAEAGFANGQGFPAVTLAWPGDEPFDTIGPAVVSMWKETLNITVTPAPIARSEFFATFGKWRTQPFSAYLEAWAADYDDPYNWANVLFDSRSDFLHTHWSNSSFDALVRNGARTSNGTQRDAFYRDALRLLDTEVPAVPLYYSSRTLLVRPWVLGFGYPRAGTGFFFTLRNVRITAH